MIFAVKSKGISVFVCSKTTFLFIFKKNVEKQISVYYNIINTIWYKGCFVLTKQRKLLRRAQSLLLALIFALSCGSVALAAKANYPIIYIYGRSQLYKNVNTSSQTPINYSSDETMSNLIREAVPYAARAMLSGEWSAYNNKTYDLLMDAFDGFALNENGEVANGSGVDFTWSESGISKNYTSNSITTYSYKYDGRLSPLEIADDLNDYIEAVKRVTGRKKVSVVARCEGTNVLFGYLQKYQEPIGYKGIASLVLYDSSLYGVDILDAAMGGKIKADSYALGKFLDYYSTSGDVSATLANAMRLLQSSYGVRMSAGVVDDFYANVRNDMVLRFLKNTYATCPGFWSMVYENYAAAKAYLFGEPGDLQKYTKLISKIDDYRKNVQLRIPDMIAAMQAKGVYVSAVCKYGFQGYPIYEDAYTLSDKLTSLERQSFGATCSKVDGTLSAAFIKECREKWLTDAFISPDEQVYSFSGEMPYTTWYIKNLEHTAFPGCVNSMLLQLCRNQIDIHTNESYPQYLVFIQDDGANKIIPMTVNNCDPTGVMGLGGNSNNNGDPPANGGSSSSLLQRLLDVAAFFSALITRLFGWLIGRK